VPAIIGAPGASDGPGGPEAGDDPLRAGSPAGGVGAAGIGPSLVAGNEQIRPGEVLRLTGLDLAVDGTTYQLVIGSLVVADDLTPGNDGIIVVDLTLPDGLAGVQTLGLRATGTTETVASATVTIAGSPATTFPVAAVVAGLGLLLVLALGIGLGRRRTAHSTAHAGADPPRVTTPHPVAVAAPHEDPPPAPPPGDHDPNRPPVSPIEPDAHRIGTASAAAPAIAPPPILVPPQSPWSRHPMHEVTTGGVTGGDLITWQGALWLTAAVVIAGKPQIRVWHSLNGITWEPPVILGTGSNPRLVADRSQLCVVADGDGPRAWITADGREWRGLASGDPGQPRGQITAIASIHGLVLLGCRTQSGSSLWLGRRDGEWITLNIGVTAAVFGRWSGRTIVLGTADDGSPAAAETDAGIRWRPIPLDVPPSFASFRPATLLPLADQAILLGTDAGDGVADAWVSPNGAAWDPAPVGAVSASSIRTAALCEGAVLAAGTVPDGGAVWRTTHGIRWRRVDDADDFAGLEVLSLAAYEDRPHILAVDADRDPVMWIRRPWRRAAEVSQEMDAPALQVVISDDTTAERPA
jgi:hypothetical protein